MDLIKINGLSAGYDSKEVISNVNLTIQDHDFIGVIGPNGGGKTTFIKTLLGIIKPIKGSIEFMDKNLKIGYLPQMSTTDRQFPISVFDYVLSGLMSRKGLIQKYSPIDKSQVITQLEIAGISNLATKTISQLSGGQFQRVALCRALIVQPQLLILDEPTTYVDNKFEKELYELLKSLNDKYAILMVSHDLGTISSYVKSIACINGSFHYHPSNKISIEQLKLYDCPIQLLRHGDIPHTVLLKH